jgi:pilus assembly protein CpaB
MARRVIAIAAAVMLAIVGVVAVVLYANGADQRAISGAQPRTVYVSQQVVPAGTSLSDAVNRGLMVATTLPAKSVPTGVLTAVTDDNKNLLAVTDIAAGEYVQAARFGTTPQGSQALRVPAGHIAVTVQLVDPAKVGTFIAPGSHIVLFTTKGTGTATNAQGGAQIVNPETRVLFDDVLVIAVGDAALAATRPTGEATASTSQVIGKLVTLALKPEQAPRLVQAINSMEILDPSKGQSGLYAGLRGSEVNVDNALVVSSANLYNR